MLAIWTLSIEVNVVNLFTKANYKLVPCNVLGAVESVDGFLCL